MKYKVGDIVKIKAKEDLISATDDLGISDDKMLSYAGKKATVTEVLSKQKVYSIDIENRYYFDESLLEDVDSSSISEFEDITSSLARLLTAKNKKYGNSALDPLNMFTGKTIVGQRIDDKLGRIKNSTELRKNDTVDLLGYLVLVCREKGWTDFDDLID